MKMTIDAHTFRDQFKQYNREDNFSPWALNKLYEHFIELEEGTGEEIELDVIAICCDYCEQSIESIKADYTDFAELETNEEIIDALNWVTNIVSYDDENVIYQAF